MSETIPIGRQSSSEAINSLNGLTDEQKAALLRDSQKAPVVPSKSITSMFPTEPVDLPSRGHFYPEGSVLSKGVIDLKQMTAREEDILTSQNLIKKGVVLDKLLEALIVTDGIRLEDLLITDKNAVFIASRMLAYGNKYSVKQTCPKCGTENPLDIDLNKITNKEFDFSKYPKGVNRFSFTLPKSKKQVEYKLLTNADETNIAQELKSLEKLSGKNKDSVSPEITTRLKYMIVSIDGKEDRSFIKKFVDTEMLSQDSRELRNHINQNSPEVDLSFNFTCTECGHEEERMTIPMGINFFWPDAKL